MLFLSAGALKS